MSDTAVDVSSLNQQNGDGAGSLLGSGKVGHAEEESDGKMTGTIRIPEDELVYEPGSYHAAWRHGRDHAHQRRQDTHCAVLLSNGDKQFVWLVNHSKGTATLKLDGPGYYWYSSPTGNDEGRGLTGAIVVGGDVPAEARLDRPPQPRPTK